MPLSLDKPAVRIAFRYFSWSFNPTDNFFYRRLSRYYRIEISDTPQIIFFSVRDGGPRWRMPTLEPGPYQRVFFTPENCRPDMSGCEWAFTFDYDDQVNHPRHLRLPFYVVGGAGEDLIKDPQWSERILDRGRPRFCNFVYSKDAPERIELFRKLSAYKKVDAPGTSMNNAPPLDGPRWVKNLGAIERALTRRSRLASLMARHLRKGDRAKITYLRNYKFTIAYENSSYPGYATEKIYHPMIAGSIPIYWGNPCIHRDFNPRSFVNAHEFSSVDEIVKRVMEIDGDDDLYRRYLDQPWLHDNRLSPFVDIDAYDSRLKLIAEEATRSNRPPIDKSSES